MQATQEVNTETVVNSKGQIIIPREIRRRLGVQKGSRLDIAVDDKNRIILTPTLRTHINALRGKYKGRGLLKAFQSMKSSETTLGGL